MSDSPENAGVMPGVQKDRAIFPSRSEVQQMELACRKRRLTAQERSDCLDWLTHTVRNAKSSRLRIMASKAVATFEATEVRDVHHLERIDQENGVMILKQQRAEQGLPNDSLALILPPTTATPMPAWMERLKLENPQ